MERVPRSLWSRGGPLASSIVSSAVEELKSYGRVLRVQDYTALQAIGDVVERIVEGSAKPKVYLSSQPTGWGKTTAICSIVREVVRKGQATGVLVMVNTLDQIPVLIERMGLRPEQYAVRVGRDEADMNDMGLVGLCRTKRAKKMAHRYAQVLFTTQQKIGSMMEYNTDYNSMTVFDYCCFVSVEDVEEKSAGYTCGTKRVLKLWDEAYLPVEAITISLGQIDYFASRLAYLGQPEAAERLKEWIKEMDDTKAAYSELPFWIIRLRWQGTDKFDQLYTDLSEEGEEQKIVTDAMYQLSGKEVRLVRQDYRKGLNKVVSISYRRTIPYNLEPVLVFDAGGKDAHYRFMAKAGQESVVDLPCVTKTYRNLHIRFFNHAAGQLAYRAESKVEELSNIVAEAVCEKGGEEVLVFHHKGQKPPATSLLPYSMAKVRDSCGTTVDHLNYGRHRATNAYKDVKHTILVGIHQVPLPSIVSLVYGTRNIPMSAKVSEKDVETMRMSRIIGDINQAVGRGAVRKMTATGDVPEGCTLDIIASTQGSMPFTDPFKTLAAMFPGATIKPWLPKAAGSKGKYDNLRPLIEAAEQQLGDRDWVMVTTESWGMMAGVTGRTVKSRLNKGSLATHLWDRGIEVVKVPGKGGGLRLVRKGLDPDAQGMLGHLTGETTVSLERHRS